ncbi:hypothetical protein [Lysobacter sp. A421]
MPTYSALSLACLLAAGLLAGCEAAPPAAPPQVDASATPARQLTESVGSDEQLSLDDRLTCQEAELFEQPPWVQAAWLAHGVALSCEVDPGTAPEPPAMPTADTTDDGQPLHAASARCTGNGSLRLFGLPVLAVRVAAVGQPGQGLEIDLRASAGELAVAAGQALGLVLPPRPPAPGPAGQGTGDKEAYQATADDGRIFYVTARQTGPVQVTPEPTGIATFGCLRPESVIEAANDTNAKAG